jgi:hypothetical protein
VCQQLAEVKNALKARESEQLQIAAREDENARDEKLCRTVGKCHNTGDRDFDTNRISSRMNQPARYDRFKADIPAPAEMLSLGKASEVSARKEQAA